MQNVRFGSLISDNGNERLSCQNYCVWLEGVIKGGCLVTTGIAENKKGKNYTDCTNWVTHDGNTFKSF